MIEREKVCVRERERKWMREGGREIDKIYNKNYQRKQKLIFLSTCSGNALIIDLCTSLYIWWVFYDKFERITFFPLRAPLDAAASEPVTFSLIPYSAIPGS